MEHCWEVIKANDNTRFRTFFEEIKVKSSELWKGRKKKKMKGIGSIVLLIQVMVS